MAKQHFIFYFLICQHFFRERPNFEGVKYCISRLKDNRIMKIVEILFFNYMTVQAFPVFTFDGSLDYLETPSYASLEGNVHLPENFIVCSSSKEASFDRAGIFSILGEDMSEWLTLVFQIHLGKILGQRVSPCRNSTESKARLLVPHLHEDESIKKWN